MSDSNPGYTDDEILNGKPGGTAPTGTIKIPPPEKYNENYALTPREFEIVRLLRRVHFWDGLRDRTVVVCRNLSRVKVLDCTQISDN